MTPIQFLNSVEERARAKQDTMILEQWNGHDIAVLWNPDTGYSYWWDMEVVSYGKMNERIKLASV